MKFSMIFEAQLTHPTREREHQLLADCVEQAVYAEQMGFDAIWAVEHHSLYWYAHMSAPEIFLSFVAARTSRIRIGHGVVCMPFGFNHPVRVAERAAMLDALSGGRLDLGAGRGGTEVEMSLLDVKEEDTYPQMEEALRIIGAMWQEDTFEWHGTWDIAPHRVVPRPAQHPHPPLFLACTKEHTLELAAEWGVGALVLGFAGIEETAHLNDVYRNAIAKRTGDELVSTVVNEHFAALCPTIVLDDPTEAFRIGARGQRFFAESISHYYGGRSEPPSEDTEDDDNVAVLARAREQMEAMLHDASVPFTPDQAKNALGTFGVNHAFGDASDAIEYVEGLIDGGADEIMCLAQMGTVPQSACMETIRQWGEHVIPHFNRR